MAICCFLQLWRRTDCNQGRQQRLPLITGTLASPAPVLLVIQLRPTYCNRGQPRCWQRCMFWQPIGSSALVSIARQLLQDLKFAQHGIPWGDPRPSAVSRQCRTQDLDSAILLSNSGSERRTVTRDLPSLGCGDHCIFHDKCIQCEALGTVSESADLGRNWSGPEGELAC